MIHAKLKLTYTALVTFLLLSVSITTHATPILIGTSEQALGINNLQIGDDFFDVSFSDFGRFDDRVIQPMAFLNDESGALDAASSIADFLTANAVTGLSNFSNSFNSIFVLIPFEFTETSFTTLTANSSAPHDGDWSTSQFTLSRTTNFGNVTYANFSQINPVNTPVGIVFIALGAFATMLKRKNA